MLRSRQTMSFKVFRRPFLMMRTAWGACLGPLAACFQAVSIPPWIVLEILLPIDRINTGFATPCPDVGYRVVLQ